MATFGVLGRGDATSRKVIEAGLVDSVDAVKDKVHVPWYGKPIPSDLETVYDWIMDNEVPFVLHAANWDDVPKAFHKCAFGDVMVGDPVAGVANACTTLLYLWDDDSATLEAVADMPKAPLLVLDLTAGLIPIEFEEEAIPEPVVSKYDDDDDDDDDVEVPREMTLDELEIMPALAVKRYASAKLGVPFATKSAAIAALFNDVEEEDPTDDAPPVIEVEEDGSSIESVLATFTELRSMIEELPQSAHREQALIRLTESHMWCSAISSKVS
jgi:hypothetical protein